MRNDLIIIKILELIQKINDFCRDADYDSFIANPMLVDACVFNLSQIGEQVNKIDDEYKECHSDIHWHEMYALRNRIVHDYEGVNLILLWEIISEDLFELKSQLENL